MLVRLLSVNPLLSLTLVLAYVVSAWFATLVVWFTLGGWYAIGFILLITMMTNAASPSIIAKVKAQASWKTVENNTKEKK